MTSKEIGNSGHSSIGASGHSQSVKSSKSFRLGGRNSQRVSLFGRARQSFVRSGGERGATLSNLRGTTGTDFEAKGDVERSNPISGGICRCLGGGSTTADVDVMIVIKGPFCFIFKNEAASAPKYAISLAHMKAKTQSAPSGRLSVALETNLGDIEFEVYLKDEETAELFQTVVSQQAAAGETDIVRKRLGHAHLLNKRASIRFAESVATKKIEDQPEAPVSTEEILANMDMNAMYM